jgi:hypothetical protein
MVLRPGACVYEASFQNLPVGTSERLIMQLEESGDPSAELRPYYTPESSEDATLVFESRFESGNLQKATRVGDWEYDLELSADTNTRGHTQWFYFSVGNTRAGQTYRFNIVNLYKSESLLTRCCPPPRRASWMAPCGQRHFLLSESGRVVQARSPARDADVCGGNGVQSRHCLLGTLLSLYVRSCTLGDVERVASEGL